MNNYDDMVNTLSKRGEDILSQLTPQRCHLWHMSYALCGEVGELTDAIKKHVVYNQDLDMDNVLEELGDIEFYLCGIRSSLGITRDTVLAANATKLMARYKGVYSDQKAKDREDKR